MTELQKMVAKDGRTLEQYDIVRHFKFETLSDADKRKGKYLYHVVGFGEHTETGETMVIYTAMYDRDNKTCIRPFDMFMSEVDHNKYPFIKQKNRFEIVDHEWLIQLANELGVSVEEDEEVEHD